MRVQSISEGVQYWRGYRALVRVKSISEGAEY